ncbi:MAG: hypothetical protein RSF83_04015 [Hungatella sp.]
MMKKILGMTLALGLTLSMAACGAKSTAAPTTAAPTTAAATTAAPTTAAATTAAPTTSAKPDLENPEYTPEQMAVAEKFADMTDRFNVLADKVNADENLLQVTALVDTMNTLVDAINEDDALFEDPKNLTPEVLQNLEDGVVVGNDFIKEIEAMIKNYEGKTIITASIEIVNDTGVEIHGLAMSPTNDTEWGGDMLEEPLAAGESGITEMTFTEDTLVWDLLAGDAEGNTITFLGIDFGDAPTEGAKLVLSAADGGEYVAAFAE